MFVSFAGREKEVEKKKGEKLTNDDRRDRWIYSDYARESNTNTRIHTHTRVDARARFCLLVVSMDILFGVTLQGDARFETIDR